MEQLEQRQFHAPPDLMETFDRVLDSSELCRCTLDFITGQRPFFRTSTGPAFVGLKGTLSFLRLPHEGVPQPGESHAPEVVLRLTIDAEISPKLLRQEEPGEHKPESLEACPKREELGRLLERRRAAELGHELPLYASEAADYIGVSSVELDALVSRREIPTHPQLHLGEEALLFYVSELNAWLATHVEPITKGAAQDSDWPERGPEDEKR